MQLLQKILKSKKAVIGDSREDHTGDSQEEAHRAEAFQVHNMWQVATGNSYKSSDTHEVCTHYVT